MKPIIVSGMLLEKLVCEICSNYLSIFPIHTKVDDTIGICGRCTITDPSYMRDEPYEFIAQHLAFPCFNAKNGCPEILTPADLADHEMACMFKKLDCPTKKLSKCQWKGHLSELTDHYRTRHTRLLLNSDGMFKIEFSKNFTEVALLPIGGELFIVRRQSNTRENLFTCCVSHLSSGNVKRSYRYLLSLTTVDGIYSYRFPVHNTDETVTIDSTIVNEKLHDSNIIIAKIEILELDKDELNKSLGVEDNDEINWELVNELKCLNCKNFMMPPIYQCPAIHSFCADCKPSRCPVCARGSIADNISLTKIVEHVVFPCKYYKDGCNHFGKPPIMKMHQVTCEYGPCKCPLNEIAGCPWISHFAQVVEHIRSNHVNYILSGEIVHVRDKDITSGFDEKFYVIISLGIAFKVHYKFQDKRFYWAVQLVGPLEECKQYRFEIDIVDSSGNNLKCYKRGLCAPITPNEFSFQDFRKYLTISFEDIELLISKFFNYEIRIVAHED